MVYLLPRFTERKPQRMYRECDEWRLYFHTVELVLRLCSTVLRPSSRLQACLGKENSRVFSPSRTLLSTGFAFGTLTFWGRIKNCGSPLRTATENPRIYLVPACSMYTGYQIRRSSAGRPQVDLQAVLAEALQDHV
jgi:hypothetical protein